MINLICRGLVTFCYILTYNIHYFIRFLVFQFTLEHIILCSRCLVFPAESSHITIMVNLHTAR